MEEYRDMRLISPRKFWLCGFVYAARQVRSHCRNTPVEHNDHASFYLKQSDDYGKRLPNLIQYSGKRLPCQQILKNIVVTADEKELCTYIGTGIRMRRATPLLVLDDMVMLLPMHE